MSRISVIMPARDEQWRVGKVVKEALELADEVIVVDDASEDGTAEEATEAGAMVLSNQDRLGYIGSIKRGFEEATGDIIVTMDADGEHDPSDIVKLVRPILDHKADLVFGRREHVPRPSERLINWMVKGRIDGVADSGTGFRAMRADLARKLELKASCTCGILALEAHVIGARITEVEVQAREIKKPRDVAWNHIGQFFRVLARLMAS